LNNESRSDEELIEAVQRKDAEGLRVIYERYKHKIYSYVLHLLQDSQLAEDCAHDVFIQVYEKASLYKPTAKFSSWLFQIARNKAMDSLRRSKVRRAASLEKPIGDEAEGDTLKDLLAGRGLNPAEAAQSAEIVALVRAGLEKLGDTDKQLVLLCDMQGLPHKEVAGILGYSEQTITVKLYRARKRLAQILKIEDVL